jgi:MinD-like ATPase involved in chromosome partitioning or flagellar assembly
MENGPVIALFMGSGKGGVGSSTITANVAWLVSQRMPPSENVGVIDAGYGVNATLSKLLGVGFTDTGHCVSTGFYDYLLDRRGGVQVQAKANGKLLVIGPGCLSIDDINWGLPELVSILGKDPNAVLKYIQERVVRLITGFQELGKQGLRVRLVLIDLPSSAFRPLAWSLIELSDVVFIVGEWGTVHVHEVNDALSLVEGARKEVDRSIPTFVVVNKVLPINTDVRRLLTHSYDDVIALPYSMVVHAVTSERRDLAVRYLNDPQTRRDDFYKDWGRGIIRISDIILEIVKARWG